VAGACCKDLDGGAQTPGRGGGNRLKNEKVVWEILGKDLLKGDWIHFRLARVAVERRGTGEGLAGKCRELRDVEGEGEKKRGRSEEGV